MEDKNSFPKMYIFTECFQMKRKKERTESTTIPTEKQGGLGKWGGGWDVMFIMVACMLMVY